MKDFTSVIYVEKPIKMSQAYGGIKRILITSFKTFTMLKTTQMQYFRENHTNTEHIISTTKPTISVKNISAGCHCCLENQTKILLYQPHINVSFHVDSAELKQKKSQLYLLVLEKQTIKINGKTFHCSLLPSVYSTNLSGPPVSCYRVYRSDRVTGQSEMAVSGFDRFQHASGKEMIYFVKKMVQ